MPADHRHHHLLRISMQRLTSPIILLLLLLLLLFFLSTCFSLVHVGQRTLLQNTTSSTPPSSCPLDFTALRSLAQAQRSPLPSHFNTTTRCQYVRQGLRLVLSLYLRNTGSFLPPLSSAASCWASYQTTVNQYIPNFDIRRSCGFQTSWIAQGCMNITTRAQFEARVQGPALDSVISNCNQSLNTSACGTCINSIANFQASSLNGDSVGNIFDCPAYATMYSAAIANPYGPTDPGTADCLFFLDLSTPDRSNSSRKNIIIIVSVVTSAVIMAAVVLIGLWFFKKRRRLTQKLNKSESSLAFSGLDANCENATLIKFSFDDIKAASSNFSRDNIIGSGGYGNVFRGVLKDGTEVAVKRFKNVSAAGDATFAHELEVIASVRHVNLVALKGYCFGTTPLEGHQRIIVCDLMKNGSLYDHLFGSKGTKLSWPIRRRIALGTAEGLAYLHHGVQPGVIHRDIKASNILLDEQFEPKVADFGLAKFTPEGMTHLSTRVAGTMGYVAPEYALYGHLTERSDVYSFGVVLLELLSRKKALMVSNDDQLTLLSDWAWALVRDGRALEVIEEDMQDMDPPEVMEKYVLIAVLCSHPQKYARPTMSEVVKLLDTDIPVPAIPDRPIPFIAGINEFEKSVSSHESGPMSTASG